MASAYECVYFNRNDGPKHEDICQDSELEYNQNEDGTYNRFDINLESGEMSLYVDGVFKFGPIRGRATITLK